MINSKKTNFFSISKKQTFFFLSSKGIFSVLLLLIGLSFSSCKIKQPLANATLKKKSARFLTKKLDSNKIVGVEWFSARGKITVKEGNKVTKFTANIKMRKDSLLWLNVKKFGAEAARVQITPDSVYVIDRIHKEYAIKDFNFIEERFNLPADLKTLEQFLLGNPILMDEKMEADVDGDNYLLTKKVETTAQSYWMDGVSFLLAKMAFNDVRYNRSVQISLGEYTEIDEKQKFSYFRSLELDSRETGPVSIDIKFSKLEINIPKDIKFQIPDRYTKID